MKSPALALSTQNKLFVAAPHTERAACSTVFQAQALSYPPGSRRTRDERRCSNVHLLGAGITTHLNHQAIANVLDAG